MLTHSASMRILYQERFLLHTLFGKTQTCPEPDSDIQVLAPFASYICWLRYTRGQDSADSSQEQGLVQSHEVNRSYYTRIIF